MTDCRLCAIFGLARPVIWYLGTYDQVMNDHLGDKIINLCVAKLSNSPAITCVSRLDLNHFASQYDSPRLGQRFPGISAFISGFY